MPDIRIEPWPGTDVRGRKRILVDGVKWGSIHMEGHGVHGPSYHFVQDGAGRLYRREARRLALFQPNRGPRNQQKISPGRRAADQ
jgi:hypothetical protein